MVLAMIVVVVMVLPYLVLVVNVAIVVFVAFVSFSCTVVASVVVALNDIVVCERCRSSLLFLQLLL